jgi:NADH-quinone oxidoreductase subunit G
MCLVEVEKMPKLAPACVTTVAEGQVIHVNSPKAKAAREGVLEFLLINHPLDCPICDQAGECELQDYVFQEGRSGTRYDEYAKRYKPGRGLRARHPLRAEPLHPVHALCPLHGRRGAGAGAERVGTRGPGLHRHRRVPAARPSVGRQRRRPVPGGLAALQGLPAQGAGLDLDKSASVCPGCTQGCNINIDTRDDVVVRLRPRPNLEVNRHFICDTGRADYRWLNRGDRIEAPLVRQADKLAATDWDTALDHVAALIETLPGSAVLLASGRAGTESLGLVKRLLGARSHLAAVKVPLGEEAPLAGVANLALRRERIPNLRGAQLLGYTADWKRALAALPEAGLIVVLDADLDADEQAMIERAPGP